MNVVTRASNGSTRVTPVCRSSARRCPSSQTPPRGNNAKLSVERSRAGGFDPYARVGAAHVPEAKKAPVKRDLRKLSEWIKLKRELDERKSQDDHDVD